MKEIDKKLSSDVKKFNFIDSAEWLEFRKNKIGSSDIGTITNLNPYESSLSLWFRKKFPDRDDFKVIENNSMWIGKELEPFVLKFFTKHTGINAFPWQDTFNLINTPFIATPDAYTENFELLELKTANARMRDAWEKGIPLHYEAQVQWQLGILGLDKAKVAAFVGGRDLFVHEIVKDLSIFETLKSLAFKFYNSLVYDRAPDFLEGNDKDLKKVSEMFSPNSPDVFSASTPEVLKILEDLIVLDATKKQLSHALSENSKKIDTLKVRLFQHSRDAKKIKGGGVTCERIITERKSYFVPQTFYETFKIKKDF